MDDTVNAKLGNSQNPNATKYNDVRKKTIMDVLPRGQQETLQQSRTTNTACETTIRGASVNQLPVITYDGDRTDNTLAHW